jgi:integrase/recombinase XerD
MSFPIQQEPVRRFRGRAGRRRQPRQLTRVKPVEPEVLAALTDGIPDRRDRAIILMLIDSGLRGSELVQLDRGSVSLNDGDSGASGQVLRHKSGRSRKFLITRRAADALSDYLNFERNQDCNVALFIDQKGNRVSTRYLRNMIHRWCDQLGVERLSLHQLRHTLALRLVERGCSQSTILQIMGYSRSVSIICTFITLPLQKHPLDTE